MSRKPLFFIVGSQRSGTTLLRLMLDHHPGISVPGEAGFLIEKVQPPATWPNLGEYRDYLCTNRYFLDYELEYPESDKPKKALKLRALGTEKLRELFEEYEIPPSQPVPDPGQPRPRNRGRPQLVMPGFLQAQGATAGVVLSPDGWILVSRFALNFDPSTILVTLADGRSFNAVRAGEDTSRGIALVKIEAEDLPVPEHAPLDGLRVGQWAFALGRTFGSDQPSVHMGIVSATDRLFGRALQIDAYTSPANYGGPVIDVRGRVMGISVPLSPSGRNVGVDWYDSGIGFASTIQNLGDLIDRMKQGEVLHRGWLGVSTLASHDGPGARLSAVNKNSPAARVGLEKNDTIVAIDGVELRNNFHLQMLVSSNMAGDPVHLQYRRGDGDLVGVTVFLGEVPIKEREAKTKKEETFTLPWEEGDPQERKR